MTRSIAHSLRQLSFLSYWYLIYGSILYHFQDKAIYWSKIAIFFMPPAFDALVRDGLPLEYCHTVWCGKIEWRGYLAMKKFEDTSSRFDRMPACDRQTDGRTDRETSCDGIGRAMQHSEVKMNDSSFTYTLMKSDKQRSSDKQIRISQQQTCSDLTSVIA